MNIKPCSVLSDTTVTQKAMMVEELLMQRSMYKALVTKSSRTLSCLIKEGDINLIQKHGVKMKAWFHSFDDVCESYLEMLTEETDITAADSYYDVVYDNYMDQLDSLNYATDTLSMQAPAVIQRVLPQSPTHQVQDDQCNKSVQISTLQQNTQPTTSSNPTHPELHINVKLQSQVSIAAITKEQQPELNDCEPPVINQSSHVSLDTHIDQTSLHVPSPTPCAHYSHMAHTTMHLDRNVPSHRLFQLANSRCTNLHLLTVPPQHQMELKETYIHSRTPRPGRKVKDGTLHITSAPRPAACHILSGVT